MSYNFSAKESKDLSEDQTLVYKYSAVWLNTYPGILGRINCRKGCWQFQILVEVIEYFTASPDYLRMNHCLWRKSSRILCTFISEGRMFPTLKRLDPTTHKGEDHMISSNSFILKLAMARRMHSTCLPPGPALDQFAWTWGALATLSGSGDSKFPT